MKLTKQSLLDLYNALDALGELGGARFAYAVARNINKLKPEVEALQKIYSAKEDFRTYDKERVELAEKHAKKVDGKPQKTTKDGIEKYVIEDEAKFAIDLKTLQEKHKDAIDARQKQLDDFQEFLKEEIEIELHTIAQEYIPENIKAKEMVGILPIISDEISQPKLQPSVVN